MDLIGVSTAVCDGDEIDAIFLGSLCVWPDPWIDIWDEGFPITWESRWRDEWSVDPPPPTGGEVPSG